MAEHLSSILLDSGELIGTVAVIISLFIYRNLAGNWPLLSEIRRKSLPFLHEVVLAPAGLYSALEQHDEGFVGRYDITASNLHDKFRASDEIYPNNFAAIKYKDKISDECEIVRHYEFSSWAHREDGLTGDTQTHLIVYMNNDDTVTVYAHYEYNPIPHPVKHFNKSVNVFSSKKGVNKATQIMEDLEVSKV